MSDEVYGMHIQELGSIWKEEGGHNHQSYHQNKKYFQLIGMINSHLPISHLKCMTFFQGESMLFHVTWNTGRIVTAICDISQSEQQWEGERFRPKA